MEWKPKILIVEDEPDMAEIIQETLDRTGFETRWAPSGRRAVQMAEENPPDVILLDLGLPDIPGMEVCARLKRSERTKPIPVIVLTGLLEEKNVVESLNAGADDYIAKPFRENELTARIRAILRRAYPTGEGTSAGRIVLGTLVLDRSRQQGFIGKKSVAFTPHEFSLIWALAQSAGIVLTREQLLSSLKGASEEATDRNVDVHIGAIRKKLGRSRLIVTVRGAGYKIEPPKTD